MACASGSHGGCERGNERSHMPKRSRPPYRIPSLNLLIGCCAFGLSHAALASADNSTPDASTTPPVCAKEPPAKKKRGLGLGGVLGAVQHSGAGRLLGGGLLGGGGKALIAGAVLGTASEVAANASQGAPEAQSPQPSAGSGTEGQQDCGAASTQHLSEGP